MRRRCTALRWHTCPSRHGNPTSDQPHRRLSHRRTVPQHNLANVSNLSAILPGYLVVLGALVLLTEKVVGAH